MNINIITSFLGGRAAILEISSIINKKKFNPYLHYLIFPKEPSYCHLIDTIISFDKMKFSANHTFRRTYFQSAGDNQQIFYHMCFIIIKLFSNSLRHNGKNFKLLCDLRLEPDSVSEIFGTWDGKRLMKLSLIHNCNNNDHLSET